MDINMFVSGVVSKRESEIQKKYVKEWLWQTEPGG